MHYIGVTFEILQKNKHLIRDYKLATEHLIFDIKINFTRKARWVLDGHKTPDPEGSTYAGIALRESAQIAFLYAALNDLDVFAGDI